MDNSALNRSADNIRILSAAMVEKAKSGHPGGAMGGADFINILFSEYLRFDPDDFSWAIRDRFFLDPGHMSPMLYSQLAMVGAYSMDDLKNFRQWGSPTPGHPEVDFVRGVENTSGPLGQGHTNAVGAAIAERFLTHRFGKWAEHNIYAFISDGGIQEEISQGAGRIAGYLGLGNFVMFYDSNDIQLSTEVDEVTTEDTAKKYESWGWLTKTIDGNDPEQIREALNEATSQNDKPFLIIGKTVMGKGAQTDDGGSFERKVSTHGQPLSAAGASIDKTIVNLGGDPEDPFQIFDEVKGFWDEVMNEKRKIATSRKEEQQKWALENPSLSSKWNSFWEDDSTQIEFESIVQKPNVATRVASSTVLGHFAENVENMIVMSADLSNSDKTDGFLKKSKAIGHHDFSGAFLHAGVSEFTMAAIANGMALHGGVIPVCGTFFVFSDYMKPAIRMAALMKLPVKYVFTHDAFRVGEDGPTHQPVEQEAQIRLLEQLKNHDGKNSLLALRPADADETTVAWKTALENTDSPTALILSRQTINNIPAQSGKSRYEEALQLSKGAYCVKEVEGEADLILVANGSEVATLVEGAGLIEDREGIKVKIISAPSEGLFREQSVEYQQSLLPSHIPTLGLTAGLPVTLQGLVGPFGKVVGLDHFGHSAPYKVLDEKLGYTAANVYDKAVEYLRSYKSPVLR